MFEAESVASVRTPTNCCQAFFSEPASQIALCQVGHDASQDSGR